jgi:hypothetical protein
MSILSPTAAADLWDLGRSGWVKYHVNPDPSSRDTAPRSRWDVPGSAFLVRSAPIRIPQKPPRIY